MLLPDNLPFRISGLPPHPADHLEDGQVHGGDQAADNAAQEHEGVHGAQKPFYGLIELAV
jgi:hypothetical protein